jgi:hypothetical protein
MAAFLLIATLLTIAGLIATSIMGFMATSFHAAAHILVALGTVVIGLFSQSMTMFFFIGTGRQLKDKVEGSPSDAEVKAATRRFSMKVSPAATFAMAVLMVTFIMGGGVSSGKTPLWLHNVLAALSIIFYARAYWIEVKLMDENSRLMERFLTD